MEDRVKDKEDIKTAYKVIFADATGKKVLEDLERRCFFYRSTFNPEANRDALLMNEGMRNVILYIKSKLES